MSQQGLITERDGTGGIRASWPRCRGSPGRRPSATRRPRSACDTAEFVGQAGEAALRRFALEDQRSGTPRSMQPATAGACEAERARTKLALGEARHAAGHRTRARSDLPRHRPRTARSTRRVGILWRCSSPGAAAWSGLGTVAARRCPNHYAGDQQPGPINSATSHRASSGRCFERRLTRSPGQARVSGAPRPARPPRRAAPGSRSTYRGVHPR